MGIDHDDAHFVSEVKTFCIIENRRLPELLTAILGGLDNGRSVPMKVSKQRRVATLLESLGLNDEE